MRVSSWRCSPVRNSGCERSQRGGPYVRRPLRMSSNPARTGGTLPQWSDYGKSSRRTASNGVAPGSHPYQRWKGPRLRRASPCSKGRQPTGGARARNGARRGSKTMSKTEKERSISPNSSDVGCHGASGIEEFESKKLEKQIVQCSSSSARPDGSCWEACVRDHACLTLAASMLGWPTFAKATS
jgi:hypothetical protein